MSESEAFASYGEWFPKLRFAAWMIMRDNQAAEDVVQTAAMDLLRTIRRGGAVKHPRTWLEIVVKRRAIDWYRAHERLDTHEAHPTDLMTSTDDGEADVWDKLREPAPSAEDVVIARLAALQLLDILAGAVHAKSQSHGLIERVADGYTAPQLAAQDNVDVVVIKARLKRVREQVRKRLTA